MKWSKNYALVVLIGIGAVGCKPQHSITKITQVPTAEEVKVEIPSSEISEYYLTLENDTLYSLDEEVEIQMNRMYKDTVSVIGVGDIMMETNYPESHYLPGNEGRDLWMFVKDILRQADVTFGNLEGVILNEGGDQKECKNPKVCYLFRTPESYLANLTDSGFDVVSLANNHAGDFGNPGRINIMLFLDSIDINYAGLLQKPFVTFKRNKMVYGMAAFAPNKGTVSIHEIERAQRIVSHLDSITDVVIVSFHGGAEGSKYEHVLRESETFYGENRGNVYEFSQHLLMPKLT